MTLFLNELLNFCAVIYLWLRVAIWHHTLCSETSLSYMSKCIKRSKSVDTVTRRRGPLGKNFAPRKFSSAIALMHFNTSLPLGKSFDPLDAIRPLPMQCLVWLKVWRKVRLNLNELANSPKNKLSRNCSYPLTRIAIISIAIIAFALFCIHLHLCSPNIDYFSQSIVAAHSKCWKE